MKEYIEKESVLNFEMEIDAEIEEIQGISKGMAMLCDYVKQLPVLSVRDGHGRLIDGDALERFLRETELKCLEWVKSCEEHGDQHMMELARQTYIAYVQCRIRANKMLTIIPADENRSD